MVQIAVCDDEHSVRKQIRSMLEQYAEETGRSFQITEYPSANELIQDYRAQFDLLFLDISMTGIDGMAAAREIRRLDPVVCLIFVTSMMQYAVEGYAVQAFGFVLKPLQYAKFSFTLEKAIHHLDARRMAEKTVLLHSHGQTERLTVSDILYCEVTNHSVTVHLHSGPRSYRIQMKEIEELLAPYGFFRPHGSYLVNHQAIERIGTNSLLLKNGETIPLAQHKRKAFMAQLTSYLGETL